MGDLTGGERGDRDYAKQIFSGKDVALSESVMKAASGDVLIYVAARAVRGKDGALLGAVAVCPRWTDFTAKTIDPIRLGRRGYGFTLDKAGRFISHSMAASFEKLGSATIKKSIQKNCGQNKICWHQAVQNSI
jgi:Cache domain.